MTRRSIQGAVALALCVLSCAAARGQAGPGTPPPPLPPPALADVPYGPDPLQRLDLYIPAGAGTAPRPLLVEIHGGGWSFGSKSSFASYYGAGAGGIIEQAFHERGAVVASVDYRLAPAAIFPAQNLDCARALQFLRSWSGFLNIDPDDVTIIGESAGAHLALWLAMNPDLADPQNPDPVLRESSRPSRVIACRAPTYLTETFLGGSPNLLVLWWYFGVASEAQFALIPLSVKQAASPAWLATVHAAQNSHMQILGIYQGDPAITTSTQIPAPTDDPHSLLFGWLMQEALLQSNNPNAQLLVSPDPATLAATASEFLSGVTPAEPPAPVALPVLSIHPPSGAVAAGSAFQPVFTLSLTDATMSSFLASIPANPLANNILLAVGEGLSMPFVLDWAAVQAFGPTLGTITATGTQGLSIALHPFDLSLVGVSPWLVLALIRNGVPAITMESYLVVGAGGP